MGDVIVAQHFKPLPTMLTIPYGCLFVSWLLYFQSSSLVMHLGKEQKKAHVFEPLPPMWKTWIAGSWVVAI